MLKGINKSIYILLIILNIIVITIFALSRIYSYKIFMGLYWLLAPVILLVTTYLLKVYSKSGLNIDNKKSKVIQRSFDDITTVTSVIYILMYLMIVFLDSTIGNVASNFYVQLVFMIFTLIFETIIVSSIIGTKKQTKKLIEKEFNKKK